MIEIGILDQGCGCHHCRESTKKQLEDARENWKNGERKIVFRSFVHNCAEGCCTDYGVAVYINGFEVLSHNGEDVDYVVEALMEFLEVDNVSVEYEYENMDKNQKIEE